MTLIGSAAAAAVAGTWCARKFALRHGYVSNPNPIVPQHTQQVAYLGGAGVAIGITSAITIASHAGLVNAVPPWLWLPATLFLMLGIADDLRPFTPVRKLLLQSVIAALAISLGLAPEMSGIAMIDRLIGWLWIIVVVNAVNVTDVCDGLVAGISIPVFLAIAILDPGRAFFALAVAGSCVGFLFFNRPPATIFLGDGGSHLLGFLIAALTPLSSRSLLPTLLVTGVFLFEVALLFIARTRKGLRWWMGSRDHFALRLQARGLSRLQTDLIAVTAASGLGAMAVAAQDATPALQIVFLAIATALAVSAGWLLLSWEVSARQHQKLQQAVGPGRRMTDTATR